MEHLSGQARAKDAEDKYILFHTLIVDDNLIQEKNMNCHRCGVDIPVGLERDHISKKLCEDCYMDALSPSVGCDPWANYIASKTMNVTTESQLNPRQKEILEIIKTTGEITLNSLLEKLSSDLTIHKLKNEMSTLRRMGLILGRNDQGTILFRITG